MAGGALQERGRRRVCVDTVTANSALGTQTSVVCSMYYVVDREKTICEDNIS
jgi:hypothetical protein